MRKSCIIKIFYVVGSESTVKQLIENGADVNAANFGSFGETALIWATTMGKNETLTELHSYYSNFFNNLVESLT